MNAHLSSQILTSQQNGNRGFSLIELLVVVAIIGLLAGAGLIAYSQYSDGVKGEATVNARIQTEKAIKEHLLVLEGGLTGPDEPWFQTVKVDDNQFCKSYVAALVETMNDDFKNQFSKSSKPFLNGHDAPGAPGPTTIEGGQTIVFCADPEARASNTRIVTCSNSGKSAISTTGTWADIFPDPNGCEAARAAPIPQNECPHPGSAVPLSCNS